MNTPRVLVFAILALAAASRPGDAQDSKPVPADQLFADAKALSAHEEWRDAIAHFRRFLREHPADPRAPEARFWVGFSLVKSGEFDEAVRALEPFRTGLARDKWADDALLQLGHAHRGREEDDLALATWKLLLETYPDSVWRTEAAVQIIDLLFNGAKDYAACLPYCERVVRDAADFAGITEARYAGAYCLNALGRYDEADRWMDRWFSPDEAVEAAWRRLLDAQRELRRGRTDAAFRTIDAIGADFPDLDREDRNDLTLRAAAMLAREKQADRARALLIAAMERSTGDSEDEIAGFLDQLEEAAGGGDGFRDVLDRLANEPALPLLARLAVRGRRVEALREDEHAEQAEALLRRALADEASEYARFRAAVLLSEVLHEDRDDREGAGKVLTDVLAGLHRGDLVHRVREALKHLEAGPEDGRE
jgi:tetratricopeptide (TPR) repeat protein